VHLTLADLSVVVSLAALATAVYGIFERGNAARRAERIRLTTIVENIVSVRRELVESVSKGITVGDVVEVMNTRLEVLSQQALSILQTTKLPVTSVECRELALALEGSGFNDDAEYVWLRAKESSQKEGDIHELYANRGFAYFLFRRERESEARNILEEALSRHTHHKDSDRVAHAETLRTWLTWELGIQGSGAPIISKLSRQINGLINECSTSRGKEMTSRWAYDPTTIEENSSAGTTNPDPNAP
jgi:hypothetical protein